MREHSFLCHHCGERGSECDEIDCPETTDHYGYHPKSYCCETCRLADTN